MRVESRLFRSAAILRSTVSGERNETDAFTARLTYAPSQFVAVDVRQVDIHQHNRRGIPSGHLDALVSGRGVEHFVAGHSQGHTEHLSSVGAVVDYQNAPRCRRGWRWTVRPLACFAREGQPHDEFSTLPKPGAPCLDLTAMQFHQMPNQREPDPEATFGPCKRRIRLGEEFKHRF